MATPSEPDRPAPAVPGCKILDTSGDAVVPRPAEKTRHAILPSNDKAAHAARTVVAATCEKWFLGHLAETAGTCASELAANAVRHVRWDLVPQGRKITWLVLAVRTSRLVVEVRDPDDRLPVVGTGIDWSAFEDAACAGGDPDPERESLFDDRRRPRIGRGPFPCAPNESPYPLALPARPHDVGTLPVSGLGLFLVEQLVREAGGEFGIVPLAQGGKSVFFALPLHPPRGTARG